MTRPLRSAPKPGGPRLALVLDPRFPGGTASAVAAEIRALAGWTDLEIVALRTAMFSDRPVNPSLQAALDESGLALTWNPPVIRADTVILHNPSCLKFDHRLASRISCDTCILVCHENFLRPGGAEAFDVGHCLALVDRALICGSRLLAPVSPWNRSTLQNWLGGRTDWTLTSSDWFNICDMPMLTANPRPRDRRGRHSRPGFEKFPPLADLRAQFPAQAERCSILGADSLMLDSEGCPDHWQLFAFGARAVADFLAEIDFFVYFTSPQWRESFGRAIAEAIAAGKLVITDPATAQSFGPAVIASDGSDIDAIIAAHVADPARYGAFVHAAQASLARFSPAAFTRAVLPLLDRAPCHAAL